MADKRELKPPAQSEREKTAEEREASSQHWEMQCAASLVSKNQHAQPELGRLFPHASHAHTSADSTCFPLTGQRGRK